MCFDQFHLVAVFHEPFMFSTHISNLSTYERLLAHRQHPKLAKASLRSSDTQRDRVKRCFYWAARSARDQRQWFDDLEICLIIYNLQ
jgi:hypothetical protein